MIHHFTSVHVLNDPTLRLSLFASLSVDLIDEESLGLSLSVALIEEVKRRDLSRRLSSRGMDGSRELIKIHEQDSSMKRTTVAFEVSNKYVWVLALDRNGFSNRPPGVKAAKGFGKKKMTESKALSAFESMWSIKKEEMALKERVTKMKLLDSLLAKNEPLAEYEEALKKKLINELLYPFWLANGSLEFPQVAEEIETQLNKYKKDLEEISMMRTGAYETDLIGNTKHLMNAVNSLPELKARKEMIDKHTNIATNLLGEIKERSLDVFTEEENEMMKGGSIDMSKVLAVLNEKGTNEDGQVEVCHHVPTTILRNHKPERD
ncbi:hypothetical protein DY000_02010163 [Brassica cretica]|uniref:Uncharacterized protein n=1 Tax=Brassica cretica TaxID=69181 RepID=A0ABQ7BWR7_BRACR|nr:hypothetical protein DY000_02010163 [Brassica cretica]